MSIEDDIVAAARGWIGTPYRHQASRAGVGSDCLGLVRGVWREVMGCEPEAVPAYSNDWSEPQGIETLWAAGRRNLQPAAPGAPGPGEVILFRMREGAVAKHLGIVSAGAPQPRFIHAYSGHGVVESALTRPWARRIVARFTFPDRP
ncbi:putative phage cell wall peptidase, NlpC/P60 family [Roseivivax lentus]|uniref:Putative phage cell wall peptidase, NlpC/P60 family n=1 Tax=Roseivivax lentus TaxID=633194 RepID=A0A1N7L451_9RHOB|nr:NlpC/P60 family protein [Roseivivax lentus]SIS68645.1 putative phage cell wall peptidase, NlpC/P60 family [Roseivivax lentus]